MRALRSAVTHGTGRGCPWTPHPSEDLGPPGGPSPAGEVERILFGMAGAVASSRFVGRTAELGRLEAAFAYARGGDPLTLCVGGEAGVGKTRLVTRFAAQARRGGGQVLVGGCIELGETALPYAPVAQALRGLSRGLEPAALDELVGPGRPLLARLLPELGQGEEPAAAGLAAGPSGQARLFEAFLALLERLADRSPTVLVVEDLHWADRSTLDLLAFLHRNLQVGLLLVLTYRSDELPRRHPLRPFLAELDRSGRADRLEVARFDRVDVANLLAGILGTRPDDHLVERIWRRSEGNAFFAEELLAASHQGDGGGRGLPPSLQNVLLSRVQVLPDEAQATLRLAAAAGVRVEHELLAAVSELHEVDLLAALREAVAHQVLVPDPATETYAFRHALTQEALYAELLPGERARLHADFARVLAERPELAEHDRVAAPARLAYHWVRAHDPARALPAAVEAGLQSEAAYGFADAQGHFQLALELWDQVAGADRRVGLDRAAVLQHAADSAYLAGDPNRAITLTRAALAILDAGRDPVRAGLLHGRLGEYLRATGGEGAFAEYEAAVRLVPASPPLAERAQVLAAFGEALISQGRYRESRDLCQEAIAIAGRIGALAEEGDARRALGVDLAFLGDLDAGVAQLGEARRIAETVGKVDEVARAFASLSGLLESFGELEEATEVALEGAELAAGQGLERWHSPFLTAMAARARFALGRWDDAEVLLDRAAGRVAPELAAARVYIHAARSQLELARGRADAAAEHLAVAREAYARTVTQPWFATPLFVAAAELALLEGRPGDAGDAVAEGLAVAGADPAFAAPLYALGLRAAADRAERARAHRDGEVALEAGRAGTALAGELRARLAPERADGAVPTPRTEAQAVLCEAELARLDGRGDPGRWAAAAAAWERLGEPYPAAYARWREAEALLLGGLARDRVEASLRAAHRTAVGLGAAPLLAEIEALARRGRLDLGAGPGTAPPPAPPSPLEALGLTAREQEVLGLVALGRTNAQIAETLFISPKTATAHVSNILAKLGVRNRVEAATIAHRLGIVVPEP
jgi:DNA-binding CsgD family transcriptional regulator/tetratricopeptide (TPR) repeat protein